MSPKRCDICGSEALVSSAIGACRGCLLSGRGPRDSARARRREELGLPLRPPRSGVKCRICVNECELPEGDVGFCGVWLNSGGSLEAIAGRGRIVAHTYLDPHPTNCVAAPVCPALGRGFPRYTFTRGVERGFYNLAVFLGGCPLDCAFCQNWEHKDMIARRRLAPWARAMSEEELASEALEPLVTCVCYFGGDPTPHSPMLLRASRTILRLSAERGQRYKRICWETSGLMSPTLMKEAAKLSLESGGIVKIDWKAWTPRVYEALTGVSGERAVERLKENTRLVAKMGREREEPPLLVVSVLLVPGYVTAEEVGKIAEHVASLDSNVPLVLLAFHPDHLMRDLPPTSRRHAAEAVKAARSAGIKEVYLGNEWLLGDHY